MRLKQPKSPNLRGIHFVTAGRTIEKELRKADVTRAALQRVLYKKGKERDRKGNLTSLPRSARTLLLLEAFVEVPSPRLAAGRLGVKRGAAEGTLRRSFLGSPTADDLRMAHRRGLRLRWNSLPPKEKERLVRSLHSGRDNWIAGDHGIQQARLSQSMKGWFDKLPPYWKKRFRSLRRGPKSTFGKRLRRFWADLPQEHHVRPKTSPRRNVAKQIARSFPRRQR